MKRLISAFLLVLIAVFHMSCESSADRNGDLLFGIKDNGNSVPSPKKLLSSVTFTDDSREPITYIYTYLSGKLNRVEASDNSISYSLFYEDSTLSRIEVIQDDGSMTTTNFNILYSNGKLIEARGIGMQNTGNSFTNIINAYYTDNKVSKITSKNVAIDSSDPAVTYELYTLQSDFTYVGNNISTWKFTNTVPSGPVTIPQTVITTTQSDYDGKKNPFNSMPEAFSIISSFFDTASTAVSGFSVNNYRNISVNTSGGTETATYVYTYDSDGYPLKGVASNNLGVLTFVYQ